MTFLLISNGCSSKILYNIFYKNKVILTKQEFIYNFIFSYFTTNHAVNVHLNTNCIKSLKWTVTPQEHSLISVNQIRCIEKQKHRNSPSASEPLRSAPRTSKQIELHSNHITALRICAQTVTCGRWWAILYRGQKTATRCTHIRAFTLM